MTPEVVRTSSSSPKIPNSNKNAYMERSFCSNSLEAVCVVKILSKISGCGVKTTKLDGEPKGLQQLLTAELTVTSQSPFDETKRVMTVYKGLYACLYQLCVLGNLQELGLLGSSPEELSRMEEWVDRCVMSSSSTSSGQELMQLVEQTLSNSSGGGTGSITYLIGSTATVADVCVSVFLYRHFMAENPNHHVVLQPWMDQLLLRHHHFLDSLQPLQRGEQQHQPQPSSPGLSSVDGYLALTPEECSANDILAALSHASIPYVAYTHTKCNTAEELVSNVPLPSSDHVHTKNLLFKDKKHGLFLVTTKANASSSASDITKSLSKLVQGKSNFRLASADTLKDTLGVEPGCVGPLCLYKDTSSAITFVLDETLVSNNYSYIHSHPLINTISCMLRPQDLLQFITQVTKHEPIVLSLLIDATSALSSHDNTKTSTGSSTADNKPKKKGPSQPDASTAAAVTTTSKVAAAKGETLLALQWKKHENFPNWYSDVIILSEMISYYNVSGCYILRPWSYKIWEIIQNWFNEQV